MRLKGSDDKVAVLGHVPVADINDDVVVDQNAPVEEHLVETEGGGTEAGGEKENEPAGIGRKVLAEEFLLFRFEAPLRRDRHKQRGFFRNGACDREVD